MSSDQLLTAPVKNQLSLSDRLKPKHWARAAIRKNLASMRRGQLILEENGEKTVYGDLSEDVSLVAELTIIDDAM